MYKKLFFGIIVLPTITLGRITVVDTIKFSPGDNGESPVTIAVNPTTNKIYIPIFESNFVFVIDGTTNTVIDSVSVGSGGYMGVNQDNNRICVTCYDEGGSIWVLYDPSRIEYRDKKSFTLKLEVDPNPFNNYITINYATPNIKNKILKIYDLSGRVVRTFNNLNQLGKIVWDGRDENNVIVSNGIYFCGLEIGNKIITEKICLVKLISY
ncbi:MAG: T9SS type A sorting domain-containing protein [bacterium]|nr:T9SS type A sorting domain-containing protein [bacterium]